MSEEQISQAKAAIAEFSTRLRKILDNTDVTKEEYLKTLKAISPEVEELVSDIEMRIEAVEDELASD